MLMHTYYLLTQLCIGSKIQNNMTLVQFYAKKLTAEFSQKYLPLTFLYQS